MCLYLFKHNIILSLIYMVFYFIKIYLIKIEKYCTEITKPLS